MFSLRIDLISTMPEADEPDSHTGMFLFIDDIVVDIASVEIYVPQPFGRVIPHSNS